MKKSKIIFLAAAVLPVLLMCGCISVSISGPMRTVTGKGGLHTAKFDVDKYTSVEISGNMKIVYSNKPSDTVSIEIQDNLLEYLTVEVKNGKLRIEPERNFVYSSNRTPVVHLSSEKLEKLTASGAISFKDSDVLESDALTLDLSGACAIDIPVNVGSLIIVSAGADSITLSGTADSLKLDMSGASSADALDLQTKEADVTINGVGNCSISCSDKLDATINGAGSLKYKGSPELSKSVSGLGSVRQVD